jgi:hypothetical protein
MAASSASDTPGAAPATLEDRVAHLTELVGKLHHNLRLITERRKRSIFWPVLGALIVWSLIPLLIAALIFFAGLLGIGAFAAGGR